MRHEVRLPVLRTVLIALFVVAGTSVVVPHASAFHIACGDTILVNTSLDSDLIGCPGHGVVIGADDVILNLKGHIIDGTFGGEGVLVQGHTGVVIKNGTIQQFNNGVLVDDEGECEECCQECEGLGPALAGAEGHVNINDNTIQHNNNGVGVNDSSGVVVNDNDIIENGHGVRLSNSDGNEITHNDVLHGNNGILLNNGSDDNLIANNDMLGQNSSGIRINSAGSNPSDTSSPIATGNEVKGNDISDTNNNGIYLLFSSNVFVHDNKISSFATAGINLYYSDLNVVQQNTVVGGGASPPGQSKAKSKSKSKSKSKAAAAPIVTGTAIYLTNSSDNLVKGNQADKSPSGYALASSSDNDLIGNGGLLNGTGIYVGNGSTGNDLVGNTMAKSLGDGIYTDQSNTLLDSNTTPKNGDDGIDVDTSDAGTVIKKNQADKNGDLGIEANEGVTDGGGNKAKSNVNPAQCTGVVCT